MHRSVISWAPLMMILSACTLTTEFGDFKFGPQDSDRDAQVGGGDGDGSDGNGKDGGGDGDADSGPKRDGGVDTDSGAPDADAGTPVDPLCASAGCDPVATCKVEKGVPECSCPLGYFDRDGDGKTCRELDECKAGLYECDDDASCKNTPGSYECECNPGFMKSGDECLDGCLVLLSTTCDANVGKCHKPTGEAECYCPAGYADVNGDGTVCAADEACMALACDPRARCDSSAGAPECSCPEGYSGEGTTNPPSPCVDVDECQAQTDDCSDNATCTNTEGGYACTCKDGYDGDGKTCSDADECEDGTDLCSGNATCTNKEAGYDCACNEGYEGDGFACADKDECELGADDCSPNANCLNTPGAFTCACKDGFSGNGKTCEDIDECKADTDNCAAGEQCTNTVGSFTCGCDAGFEKNGSGVCVDINECTRDLDNCSTNADCTNVTTGAPFFTCKCKAGYEGDGVTCTDIDECDKATDNCHAKATCANTAGSFTCDCNDGYDGSGVSCTDVNECDLNTDNCHPTRGTCTNTAGSFTCGCMTGYRLGEDKTSCSDIDECASGTDTCDSAPDACVNKDGGYDCTCPAYWEGTGQGANGCTDKKECATNNGGCGTYYSCTENAGAPPSCADINECATNNGGCGSATYYSCTNKVGAAPACGDINECATNNGGCGSATYYSCTNKVGAAPACADIDECATNNGGCGAVSAWTCTNNHGAIPTCTDKNECTLGTHNCDTAPVATCSNTIGGYSCLCPAGFQGSGVGTSGCTDIVNCTGASTDPCDDAPLAACSDTPLGSYTCTCPAGYAGLGIGQTGCCTPDGNAEASLPNDGKDNDCNGTIDIPGINMASSFPHLGGAAAAAHVSIAVTASVVSGATLQCRSYKRSGTPGAFAGCTNPVKLSATSTDPNNNGLWRTEVRWLYSSGALSAVANYDYYVHSSLHYAGKCVAKVSDEAWFKLAAERLGTPSAGTFVTSGSSRDTYVNNPFVRVSYKVPLGGIYNSDDGIASILTMDGTQKAVDMLSLRRRFTVSADGKYLLILRTYASSGGGSCSAFKMRAHDSEFDVGGNKYKEWENALSCQAVVLNRSGAGVCMNDNGLGSPIFVRDYNDSVITAFLGYKGANKFMWRQLVQKEVRDNRMRNFSTKCYSAPGCPGIYLPDRSFYFP